MAQFYATVNCHQYLRISTGIRMTLKSPQALASKQRVKMNHDHVELIQGDKTVERSTLGLYAMNGGEGPLSYVQNSSYQRGVVDVAKPIIEEEIAAKLDIKQIFPNQLGPFCIADFGCSTGHNSFPALQIIIDAVEKKFQLEAPTPQIPDFHVSFNDQVMNDFNTLFHSLPPQRRYYAAGVPSPFHVRLLPKASLHFGYCSCSLNWLSDVPKEVAERSSPAWNKGKIHYTGAKQEVFDAYSNHYAKDIESFLEARAEELVSGGLMVLLVPAVPTFKNSSTTYTTPTEMDLIGSCLMDMPKMGIVTEEKVDSFNFPLYFTIPEELKAIIGRNQNFKVERMEILNNPGKRTLPSANARATYLRACFEGLLENHFGSEIMNELFDRYTEKLASSPLFQDPQNEKSIIILVLLKRKVD